MEKAVRDGESVVGGEEYATAALNAKKKSETPMRGRRRGRKETKEENERRSRSGNDASSTASSSLPSLGRLAEAKAMGTIRRKRTTKTRP